MYQKLLKNIQARINAKDNDMVATDSITNPNPNKNLNNSTTTTTTTTNSSSNNTIKPPQQQQNHVNSSSLNNNNNDMEDEKDEYSIDDLLNAEPSSPRKVENTHDRKRLFIKQLKLCCIIFDFTLTDLDQNHQLAKEAKSGYLLELVEYVSQSKHWFSEDCIPIILQMIETNLFRSLPPPIYQDFDPEEDEPNFDPSWPHLQFVYEFFHRFVMTADVKIIRGYIDKRFLLNMIDLFNSEDPRERDYVKIILHRIYGRCMPFRSLIRKAMNNILYPVIYSNAGHNGISELLEIFGSIINGFALPLKEEYILLLRNVLIPMHKVSFLSQFHAQLVYCVTQFIQKDPSLATSVIGGMLKFWPIVSCQKELLYLNELEEILELTETQELEKFIEPLFCRVAESICSNHFQVAERALFLWNICISKNIIHIEQILPIIYPALQENYSKHWNASVSELSLSIIGMFKAIDEELYEEVCKNYNDRESSSIKKQKRDTKWKVIHEIARMSPLMATSKIIDKLAQINDIDLSHNGRAICDGEYNVRSDS